MLFGSLQTNLFFLGWQWSTSSFFFFLPSLISLFKITVNITFDNSNAATYGHLKSIESIDGSLTSNFFYRRCLLTVINSLTLTSYVKIKLRACARVRPNSCIKLRYEEVYLFGSSQTGKLPLANSLWFVLTIVFYSNNTYQSHCNKHNV